MPVIQDRQIQQLISLFNQRGVNFYHACQYKDFKTYLQLGGIPSRNLMESSGFPYTVFDTDDIDKDNEVCNKVFGNLSDFGVSFAKGKRKENTAPTPNPYGPILLIFKSEAFAEAIDIAICLRSAGGRGFNRDAEALSYENIDRIFSYKIEEAPNNYAKAYIKFSPDLRREFNNPQAMSPEVSLSVENERISFHYLDRIIVDSYVVNGITLTDKVEQLKQQYQLNGVVEDRKYNEGRREIQQELADLLLQEQTVIDINDIFENEDISDSLKDYINRINIGNIKWQYERFTRYLLIGTLLELKGENEEYYNL